LNLRTVLGKPSWLRVAAVVILFPGLLGYGFWAGGEQLANYLQAWGGRQYQQVVSLFIWTGAWWVLWMVLLSGFQAALLFCFRVDGQRLTRPGRGRDRR
jgi:hypothetical protein